MKSGYHKVVIFSEGWLRVVRELTIAVVSFVIFVALCCEISEVVIPKIVSLVLK